MTAVFCISPLQPAFSADEKKQPAKLTPEVVEFFEKQVRPVLIENCFKCHSDKKQEAGLRLDSRSLMLKGGDTGPAVVPGQPQKSELIDAINYNADGYQMPPSKKLKAAEIRALTKWVKMGAPWPNDKPVTASAAESGEIDLVERAKHWSFQPIQKVTPPTVKQTTWPRNPIDNFILAKLEATGLAPTVEADKRTLLRRVTFDIVGLPPTAEDYRALLADRSPDAYEKAVEKLLASPRYGERWSRHWLDLVRFAETAGHEFDFEIRHAWPYRDYLIRAFNSDLPYDQFTREHIAGDLLPNPRRNLANGMNESVIGTAFFWFAQGKHSPVDIRAEECDTIDNQIDVLTKTFLGLTVSCSRCHDHKFDPIRTKDYYALAGYLQSSRQQFAYIDSPDLTQPIVDEIETLKNRNRSQLVEFTAAKALSGLNGLAQRLLTARAESVTQADKDFAKLLETSAGKNDSAIFHPWMALLKSKNTADFERRKTALLQRYKSRQAAAAKLPEQAELFESFAAGSYDNWFTTGFAFGNRPSVDGDLRIQSAGSNSQLSPVPAGLAHSGLVSGKLQGTIRSATFEIKKSYIDYRMYRTGGRASTGRRLKNGHVSLIIDGFHLISNPLYGGLTINVRQDAQFGWYRQDLRKFIGHKAYIEVVDDDDGYLVIDQVVFSDGPVPQDKPHDFLVELLEDPAVTSSKLLAERYQQLLLQTVQDWSNAQQAGNANSNGQGEFLTELLGFNFPRNYAPKTSQALNKHIAALFAKLRELDSKISKPTVAMAMVDGTGENEHVHIRGNHTKVGDLVPRRFLEIVVGENAPTLTPEQGCGRLQLANDMLAPDTPFPPRVLVNRLWLHHFRTGIVRTPDNFGKLGQPPSHPELLDYLASEFVRHDWSIKQMHRMMVLSSTYRMASSISNERAEVQDPNNILLHRMHVKRLEGEAIRDSLLAISGRLSDSMYGASVMPFLTSFMEGRGRPRQSGPLDGNGRRSIYISVRRNFLTPMFQAFDYPTPLTTMGRRSTSNVPAQALTLMNNPLVVEQTKVWAKKVLDETPELTDKQRIHVVYETVFGRLPTTEEVQFSVRFLKEQSAEYNGDPLQTWSDLCHVLLNVKEFIFIR